jgi:hypothetical protein
MDELDLWVKKLEAAKRDEKIPWMLYKDVRKYIKEAFINDYNLIIEEYDFYYQLPPQIQSEVSIPLKPLDCKHSFQRFPERLFSIL